MLEEATMQPERRSVEAAVRLDNSAAERVRARGCHSRRGTGLCRERTQRRVRGKLALKGVDMKIFESQITAFIGPSGCGKSTYIRCFNRMNDLIPGAEVQGEVLYHGQDLYATATSIRCRSAA